MHVWSKPRDSFPARGQETQRRSFKTMRNNSDCFHLLCHQSRAEPDNSNYFMGSLSLHAAASPLAIDIKTRLALTFSQLFLNLSPKEHKCLIH
jgi:hypothetical protein